MPCRRYGGGEELNGGTFECGLYEDVQVSHSGEGLTFCTVLRIVELGRRGFKNLLLMQDIGILNEPFLLNDT